MSLQDYTNVTECITCGEPTADVREFIRKHAGAFRRYAIPCHSRWSIKGTTDGCEETLTARLSDERLWPAIEALNDLLWRLATASGSIEVDPEATSGAPPSLKVLLRTRHACAASSVKVLEASGTFSRTSTPTRPAISSRTRHQGAH